MSLPYSDADTRRRTVLVVVLNNLEDLHPRPKRVGIAFLNAGLPVGSEQTTWPSTRPAPSGPRQRRKR